MIIKPVQPEPSMKVAEKIDKKAFNGMKLHFNFLCLLLLITTLPVVAQKQQILKKMDDQSYAAISFKRGSYVDVRVAMAEELIPALKIYTGQFGDKPFSYKKTGAVKIDSKRALVPFSQLAPGFQKMYLARLWPEDRLKSGFWHHTVTYAGHETLWTLSELFTGKGNNYQKIKKASGLKSDRIGKGSRLKIPESMLRGILQNAEAPQFGKPKEPVFAVSAEVRETSFINESDPTPMVSAPGDPVSSRLVEEKKPQEKPQKDREPDNSDTGSNNTQTNASSSEKPAVAGSSSAKESRAPPETQTQQKGTQKNEEAQSEPEQVILDQKTLMSLPQARQELTYGQDSKGRYAQYKLKAGEAIYSSVVVRFCGLVKANDVNQVAAQIIQRNNIKDETDLAIGHPIRIPYELLESEYKEESDPDFLSYVKNLKDISKVSTRVLAKNLEGVYVILDSGHGGRDPGARFGNVWEDDFVYDIVARIKRRLERETSATVFTTVLDPSVQYKVQNVARFSQDNDEMLLTSPRYPLKSARATTDGVNLRWLLANHRFQKLKDKGVPEENVVFASFHADSLHKSLRGSMVYVPDARKYPKSVTPSRKFKKYREYKGNSFSTSPKAMLQAQARSMNFARHFISESRKAKLLVHRQKPIRTVIFRNPTTPFVPAVLRYNRIPTRCLIEVCNLNNKKDRELLKEASYRQDVADAFVAALYRTYGQTQTASVVSAARTGQSGK